MDRRVIRIPHINGTKRCYACNEWRGLAQFSLDKSRADGLQPRCKGCYSAYLKANRERVMAVRRANHPDYAARRYRENNDRLRKEARDRWAKDPEPLKAAAQKWRTKNKSKLAQYRGEYLDSNRPAIYARNAWRRALRIQATPPWADKGKILEIYERCRQVSLETGILHHVDHIAPLKGKNVSGLHVHTNLQILPALENIKKNNRFEAGAL